MWLLRRLLFTFQYGSEDKESLIEIDIQGQLCKSISLVMVGQAAIDIVDGIYHLPEKTFPGVPLFSLTLESSFDDLSVSGTVIDQVYPFKAEFYQAHIRLLVSKGVPCYFNRLSDEVLLEFDEKGDLVSFVINDPDQEYRKKIL